MPGEKILPGAAENSNNPEAILSGEQTSVTAESKEPVATTLKERLALSTASGGLKQLPEGFDDQAGDWKVIHSDNPFEVLYLDYQQYRFITSDILKGNYSLLEEFWKSKADRMNTGGNRIAFKNKYGEGTIENSLNKLKKAYNKLSAPDGVAQYYTEINNARIQKGEEQLKDSLEHMTMDGVADKSEVQLCLNRGLKYGLTPDETAVIIKKTIDALHFQPYGTLSGESLIEQLLSVNSWMTQEKREAAEKLEEERKLLQIQILPGKYASTMEQVGSILFDDPAEAKTLIKDDLLLLQQSIAQKDIVLAREIGNIAKTSKDREAVFLSIVYRLNRSLPYRFSAGRTASGVAALCSFFTENELAHKQGKDQFKKGYIEIWLKETNPAAYSNFLVIRDSAENLDLAFLRFIYTFNKDLPYLFDGINSVKQPQELCTVINKDKKSWDAGKQELFNQWIPVWLDAINQSHITAAWNKVRDAFQSRQDNGLEYFLHLLKPALPHADLSTDTSSLAYPGIQSGEIIQTQITFTNKTRGYTAAYLTFSKNIPGVSVSPELIAINNTTGVTHCIVTLSIDSGMLVKGVHYDTSLVVTTFEQQKISIPVTFTVVFPRKAFITEICRYAVITAVFFALIRLLIATKHSDWLGNSYNTFVHWEIAREHYGYFALFGGAFFLFAAGICTGLYFLIKYLIKR
ncbi:hypothetical protein [uncultured Chitinophaga sp.]|jgi:hypothetical protein|uniref:hypothetical protein n=1 Tax=uncultured Chitinophaga sp. TaxID=339340 RepID=UPI00261E01BC|nr:hypothetical protein [uncultured Chitinophaga sp.]